MPKSKNNSLTKGKPSKICFSFAYNLGKCITVKSGNFFFTNQIPSKEIKKYRVILENALKDWSAKIIQELERARKCYPVQEKDNETKHNSALVFKRAGYQAQWIEQNIQDPDVYKFKVDSQIRMFGIVERNVVQVLLYDI